MFEVWWSEAECLLWVKLKSNLLFVPLVKTPEHEWRILPSSLYDFRVDQRNVDGRWLKDILSLPQGFDLITLKPTTNEVAQFSAC